jgi:23S rRNA pseudouridine1911/1915/1917 synthase
MFEKEIIRSGRFEIPVLYCDNHVLAVVKPCNIPVQADSSGDADLLTVLKKYVGEKFNKPGAVYLGLVHRLDRPVGGVMVFARTSKAAQRLSEAFASHTVDKRYLAVLQGTLKESKRLENWLLKDNSSGNVRAVAAGVSGAKQALLDTRPIAQRGGTTLTEVELHTGRAHQIRVQHLAAGYPLWGDSRYGGGKAGQQIALWAYRLTFKHPTLKTDMTFCVPPAPQGIWKDYADLLEEMNHE